jgi:arsenate reductase
MAEGFAKKIGKGLVEAYSAGSRPSGNVNQDAVSVMREEGIDISSQRPKGFGDIPVSKVDVVITLGCSDVCPVVLADRHIDWDIADPEGRGMEKFRVVRDQIKEKIWDLVKELSENGNFVD